MGCFILEKVIVIIFFYFFFFFFIYSNTYSSVQMNSNRVWKWQWYCLVEEYQQRPVLPAPLIFLSHLYHGLKFIYRKILFKCRLLEKRRDMAIVDQRKFLLSSKSVPFLYYLLFLYL